MAMNARHRIQEWFHRLEQPGEQMKREDVCFLMAQARHLVERDSAPERYRLISFYADWTVHSALDRSIVCCEVLRDITRVLAENFEKTRPDISKCISQVIGFPRLRSELLNLFRANGLPIVLFEYLENWNGFVAFLLWHLAGTPISFPGDPQGRAKEIREEMLGLQRPHSIVVEALAVVNHHGVPSWLLEVSGEKQIKMVFRVDLAEPPTAFSPPP
jgi:hypothetical protein